MLAPNKVRRRLPGMHSRIHAAAQLIAEIDPALARAFLSSRFQRHNLVTAFHRSLQGTRYGAIADELAMLCRAAIDVDQATT